MRFLLLFLLISCSTFGQLQPILWQVKSDTIQKWNYHFGDEFTSSKLDNEKWFDTYAWGGLLADKRIYSAPEMVVPNEGFITLKADTTSEWRIFPEWMINKEATKKAGVEVKDNAIQLKYLNSCIWSRQSFKYGYFECRCKAPSGKGLWPAFWIFGQNNKDEIDIMEMKGERANDVHVDVHVPNKSNIVRGFLGIKKSWGGWIKMNHKITDEWAVFSAVWEPGSVTYYVNGVPVSQFNGDFATPMNVVANLANAVDNGPFNPGPDETTIFPNEFLVDYIRVWKSKDVPAVSSKNIFDENKIIGTGNLKETKIKRKVKVIYDKKRFKNEEGFVSLIPLNSNHYQIQLNGGKLSGIIIKVIDASNKTVLESKPTAQYSLLNLSQLKRGAYKIELQYNNKTQSIPINL
ncbi:MAG: glycoside hydrolase family 16 protein [Flavobacteriales bacterium]|nr:glycoside hydrolase family 16 protein [Crocinitomicaceae bacterium]NBX80333.1 glycoside hydrolase family 16 protein [Flavobacteriales bacterium]NCA19544.1 glycoside hydrolase family 16 protein [Crocinitomicaceae bacterium]